MQTLSASFFLLAIILTPFSLQAQEEAAIRKAFDAVGDALRTNDYDAYVAHLHPDMTIFLPEMDGLGTTGANPGSIHDGFSGRRVMDIDYQDVQVSQLDNTALVTAFVVGKVTWDGNLSWEGKRKLSSMYVKDGDTWKWYHTHISSTVE